MNLNNIFFQLVSTSLTLHHVADKDLWVPKFCTSFMTSALLSPDEQWFLLTTCLSLFLRNSWKQELLLLDSTNGIFAKEQHLFTHDGWRLHLDSHATYLTNIHTLQLDFQFISTEHLFVPHHCFAGACFALDVQKKFMLRIPVAHSGMAKPFRFLENLW